MTLQPIKGPMSMAGSTDSEKKESLKESHRCLSQKGEVIENGIDNLSNVTLAGDLMEKHSFLELIKREDISLLLCGIGTRRKNIFVATLDVYLVGLYLSTKVLSRMQIWRKRIVAKQGMKVQSFQDTFAAAILDHASASATGDIVAVQSPAASVEVVSVLCKYLRDVGRDIIVEALQDAMKGF